jgi:two-component system, NtrC family, response regulator HydG
VQLPPLRERREDVGLLARHFVEATAAYGRKRLSASALACLEAYTWPGNVRELEHAIERAAILAKGEEIQAEDLPPEVARGAPAAAAPVAGSLEAMERQHIVSTLREVGGHRGKAAALLEVDPKTLYRKIIGYQITAEEWK